MIKIELVLTSAHCIFCKAAEPAHGATTAAHVTSFVCGFLISLQPEKCVHCCPPCAIGLRNVLAKAVELHERTKNAEPKRYSNAPCRRCCAYKVICVLEDEHGGNGTYYDIRCEACADHYRVDGPDA